ncbi:leucine-rich repeat domain-containing protein [Carboxylicivirga linearis]|uniref:Leucine-rich repeat protein n=1 Tax=Carboxylicivirga linearis TaxID=1628157 RepID=A0ABS5JTN8_9BACT|nr:leucine-rich repeat domain-containing protein [Carboxylicivirga linearis]MBS2098271.1 leucine-rich repeat protein [Carboxylicivirga linearis]
MINTLLRKLECRIFAILLLFNLAVPGLFAQYQLTSSDVEMDGGTIIRYKRTGISSIIIPNEIDGIQVTGIANSSTTGVFESKGLVEITLPSELKKIGTKAFYNNALASLSIPSNVTSIGTSAFAENKIQNLSIPQNVETISEDAFRSNELTMVDLKSNSNLRYIGKYAFGFNNLTQIVMPTSSYGSYDWKSSNGYLYAAGEAFNDFTRSYTLQSPGILNPEDLTISSSGIITAYHRKDLTIVIIPEEVNGTIVKGIADDILGVFASKGIENLELPSSIEYIGENAFWQNPIKTLILPSNLKDIGKFAFYNNNLQTLEIPSSVESIGEKAFYSNPLKEVKFEANSMLLSINSGAFYNTYLTQIQLPSSGRKLLVDWSGSENLMPGDYITDFESPYTARFATEVTDADVIMDGEGKILSCTASSPTGYLYIPELLDGQTVTGIADALDYESGVFYQKGIKRIFFPSTMEYIGDYAFTNNRLNMLDLPEGVKKVGISAFESSNITELIISPALESIEKKAFFKNDIVEIHIPTTLKSLGEEAFANNMITQISFDDNISLTNLNKGVFASNKIKNLTIPASIINIEESAFSYNLLTNVSFPEGLQNIGSQAFESNSLETLLLPSTLTTIGIRAFRDNQLTKLILPDGITSIGSSAFSSNELLIVQLSKGLNELPFNIFNYNNLSAVDIPAGIETIREGAFTNNKLETVNYEIGSALKLVEKNAFSDNPLISMELPIVDNPDFYGWTCASETFFPGEQVDKFTEELSWVIMHELSFEELKLNEDGYITNAIFDYSTYQHIIIPSVVNDVTIKGIYSQVFRLRGLRMVHLSEGIEYIGNDAFIDNKIKEINIPASVETIQDRAFSSNSIQKVTFEENCKLKKIGANAFQGISIILPTSAYSTYLGWRDRQYKYLEAGDVVESSGPYYLRYIHTLTEEDVTVDENGVLSRKYGSPSPSLNLIIPETIGGKTVKILNNKAYLKGEHLESLQLPAKLEEIGDEAFKDNVLKELTIPATVKQIGTYAFANNDLTNIIVREPSNLILIDEMAFSGNEQLVGIKLPETTVSDFEGWLGSNNQEYAIGEIINDFEASYSMAKPYTLQSSDFTLNAEGLITGCSLDFKLIRSIIIPE